MKKVFSLLAFLVGLSTANVWGAVDPNFYIYLCFGQSNMEGNAQPQAVDKSYVDPRFQMLATCDFSSPKRTMGEWYTAECPIVSPWGGLGMADYFGRTMVAALPSNVKVGVVDVAIGGIAIEGFMSDKIAGILAKAEGWQAERIRAYGSDPYRRLVDMGKKAMESGVIKGILLHQGCSNNGDPNWPANVKKIYDGILSELGLQASDVPLFVGETERADMGGGCSAHNAVVAKIPEVIPTGHVVSSEGIPGNGTDPWHFSAAGYRTFGKRYAYEVLSVMGLPAQKDAAYTLPDNMKNFITMTKLNPIGDIQMRVGATKRLTVNGTFADGHVENLTSEVAYSSSDFSVTEDGAITASAAKKGTVTVSYTDFTGQEFSIDVNVEANDLGPNHVLAVDNHSAGTKIWDKQVHCELLAPMVKGKNYVVKATIKADNAGMCELWPIWKASPNRDEWGNSADVQYLGGSRVSSTFQEYTWEFTAQQTHDFLQFVFGQIGGKIYFDDVTCVEKGTTTEMVPNGSFESEDLSKWTVLGYTNQSVSIEEDVTNGISTPMVAGGQLRGRTNAEIYDLTGRRVARPVKGIYIVGGKKVVKK